MAKSKKQTKQIKNKKKKLSKGAKVGISLGCILPVLGAAGAGIAIALVIPQGLIVEGGSIDLEYGNKTDTKAWSLKNKDKTYKAAFEVVDPSTLEKVNGVSINSNGIVSWNETVLTKEGKKQFKVKATIVESSNQESYYSNTITLRRQADPKISVPTGIVATEGLEGSATDKPFTLSRIKGVTEQVKWSVNSDFGLTIDESSGVLSWPSTLFAGQCPMTITATMGYYKVNTNFELSVVQDVQIVEKEGKTDFYSRTAAETMFGNFSFVIRSQAITSDITWKIYEGESGDESQNFGMISLNAEGEYTIKILSTTVQSSDYILKIVGSCEDPVTKQTVTSESIVTYHGYTFNLNKPKIYGGVSQAMEPYQCNGTIQTPDGEITINPNKCQWSLDVDGLGEDVVSIDNSGKISIKENTTIHTDNSHKVWVNIENYEVSSGEFITINHANIADIQVGTPSLSGGETEITLDESGNYQASQDKWWTLKIDDFAIPSDVTYTVVEATESLQGKIEIGNAGGIKIVDGEDGSFKVQASYNNIVITTDTIAVSMPEEETYSIRSLPTGSYCYAAQGYLGGLQNNLVVYKGENPLSSDVKVTWNAQIEQGASAGISIYSPSDTDNTGHMTWGAFTEEPSELDPVIYDITVTAKINGVQDSISETLHLQIVDPTKVINVNPDDTTWEITNGVALDHEIPFSYNEGEEGVVPPSNITIDGSSSGNGITAKLSDDNKKIIVSYSGKHIFGYSETTFEGWVEGKFYYYGSFVTYKIHFTMQINQK